MTRRRLYFGFRVIGLGLYLDKTMLLYNRNMLLYNRKSFPLILHAIVPLISSTASLLLNITSYIVRDLILGSKK